jgi:hypothetical protein
MKNSVKKEVEKLIKYFELNCSIEEFKDEVNWCYISYYQNLSKDFIREFQDKLDINYLIKNDKITKEKLIEMDKVTNIYELLQL